MKPTVRFFRHDGICRADECSFQSPGPKYRSPAGFDPGLLQGRTGGPRPTHRRDEYRPVIPQRVARQHCPPPLHRHAHPNSVPGSGTMNLQRTVNSVLTVCLSPGDHPNPAFRLLKKTHLCRDHSQRSVSLGSILLARRAGIHTAVSATALRRIGPRCNFVGSVAVTPNKNLPPKAAITPSIAVPQWRSPTGNQPLSLGRIVYIDLPKANPAPLDCGPNFGFERRIAQIKSPRRYRILDFAPP